MTARTRTQDTRESLVGSCEPLDTWDPATTSLKSVSNARGYLKTTTDIVGNRTGVNPFSVVKTTLSRGLLNGTHEIVGPPVRYVRKFTDYPVAYQSSAPTGSEVFPNLTELDISNYAWLAMGKTNPSVSHVNAIQTIVELKDLPSLVRGWGGNLLRRVAKGHLSWRFAVKPMISDIRALLSLQKAFRTKMFELQQLKNGGFIGKRCSLGSKQSTVLNGTGIWLQTQWMGVKADKSTVHTEQVWATVQWKLANNNQWLPKMSGDDKTKFVNRLLTGINGYGALKTAWELMPWSWFVDWFWNIGALADATNNSMGLSAQNMCLMRRRLSRSSYKITESPPNGVIMTTMFEEADIKERFLMSPLVPLVPVSLNVLTNKQLSIITDLVVLRTTKSGRGR